MRTALLPLALVTILRSVVWTQVEVPGAETERVEIAIPVVDEHGAVDAASLSFSGCLVDPNARPGHPVLAAGACGAAEELRGAVIASFESLTSVCGIGDPVPSGIGSRRAEPGLLTWDLSPRPTVLAGKELRLELWIATNTRQPESLRMAHVEWTGVLFAGTNRLPVVKLEFPPLLVSGRVIEPDDARTSGTYFVRQRIDPFEGVQALVPESRTSLDLRFELRGLSIPKSLEIGVSLNSCLVGHLMFPVTRVARGEESVAIVGTEGIPFLRCVLADERVAECLPDQKLLRFRARDASAPERSFPLSIRSQDVWCGLECSASLHLMGALPAGRYDMVAILDDGKMIEDLGSVTIPRQGEQDLSRNPAPIDLRHRLFAFEVALRTVGERPMYWRIRRSWSPQVGESLHEEIGRFLHSSPVADVDVEADGFETCHVTLHAGRTEVTLLPGSSLPLPGPLAR